MQASEDALLASEASLQPMNELGIEAPARPFGRGAELLAKMHRHPEQKAIDLPRHLSGGILYDLRSDIKRNLLNIAANIHDADIRSDIPTHWLENGEGRPQAALSALLLVLWTYDSLSVQAPNPCVVTYMTRFTWSIFRCGTLVVGRPGWASFQPVFAFCRVTMPKSLPA